MPSKPEYSAGTGLSLSGTTFNHSNSITAASVGPTSSVTLTPGGTGSSVLPYVSYDAQGHVTGFSFKTLTIASNISKKDGDDTTALSKLILEIV
jgi:hypothetical protein